MAFMTEFGLKSFLIFLVVSTVFYELLQPSECLEYIDITNKYK